MNRSYISGIGRTIDPGHPSNLFALGASVLSGAAWMIWKLASEGDWGAAASRGLAAAVATFLAWAIARELDPDRPWTAGVAAVATAGFIGAGLPSLLVAGGMLMAVRVTARTTGLTPLLTDLIALAAFSVVLGVSDAGLGAGVVLGSALVADRFLPGSALAASVPIGAIGAAGAVVAAATWGRLGPTAGLPSWPEWVIVPVAVLGLAALGRPRRVDATADYRRVTLSATRVRSGRVVAVAGAGFMVLWLGGPGLVSGSVVWAALAAAALLGGPVPAEAIDA